MTDVDLVVAGFTATVLLWLCLSAAVVANRARHDHRTRRFEPAKMSRRVLYGLIADSTLPQWQHERCVAHALDRWGFARIRADAEPGRAKWRRVAALLALAQVRPVDAYDLLERALEDRDGDVASTAIVALSRIGDRRAAQILLTALVRENQPPSRIATQLDQLSIPIDDLVRPLLRSPHAHARYWAVLLLRRYPGAGDVSYDVAALNGDAHAPVRKAVLETLIETNAELAMKVAEARIDDPVAYVRSRAARAFGVRRGESIDDVARVDRARRIAPMLGDADWTVRTAAKETLVSLGPVVWGEVSHVLQSPDRFARNGAAEVLQNLGVVDRLLEQAMRGTMNGDGSEEVLQRALREGGPAMIDAAVARVSDTDSRSVGRLLARFGYVRAEVA